MKYSLNTLNHLLFGLTAGEWAENVVEIRCHSSKMEETKNGKNESVLL